jgi:hypothetical protein
MFIPHEVFTPQKYVHSSMRGSAGGGTPFAGFEGPIPPAGGSGDLIKVYCNFIVNLDRSL